MNKLLKIVSAFLLMTTLVVAQKKEKEIKYEKIFYKDTKVETADYTLIVSNAVSTDAETKFKIKVVNKTNSYLIYKPEESKFTINGKTIDVKEKQMLIDPFQSETKVINIKGEGYNRIKTYSFLAGGIYKITPGAPIPAEDFKLPPAKNEIAAGPFVIKQEKLSKETDKTIVKFNCLYTGDKMGLVAPQKANMRMPDGKVYATTKKEKPFIVAKGENDSFVLEWDRMQGGGKATDMQFADMMIMWNDMLNEASLEKTNAETINLEFDDVKTK
ncbi:MAG: hypothetical protein ABI388_04865 [Bacteroidia bacterium]